MIPGSKTTVGTCGLCDGPVSVPNVWMSVIPPVPTCENCGATAKPNHGPVLPMNPPQRRRYVSAVVSSRGASLECCVR